MNKLCTICARGGSKGVPGKNIRVIGGKPLIVHTIDVAKRSRQFDKIAVSSDSAEILDVASKEGVDFLIKRPAELASDFAAKPPVIKHCVEEVERKLNSRFDLIVDLDSTSPLRIADDINGAINLLETTQASNVITGSLARRSPYFNLVEVDSKEVVRLSKSIKEKIDRRQDSPKCYDMNASIYVWKRELLDNNFRVFYDDTRIYVMPEKRSYDIDNELDFTIVKFLMEKNSC